MATTLVAPVTAHADTDPADAGRPSLAFPGARGFGSRAQGGRGGDVAAVTTLADDGPGSLRHAVETATGPRTIVFGVGGIIDLEAPLRIRGSHLTIAGQTAPGGITLRGYPVEVVDAEHMILRHLRFRPGDRHAAGVPGKPGQGNQDLVGDAGDALSILASEHVIVDHVSASWSMDETLSVTKSADVTVAHSIISESLDDSFHPEGLHGYGSLVRGTGERGYTFWRNLWAHHQRRMPAIGGQQDPPPAGVPGEGLDIDLVNNVIYDWGLLATHTLEYPYQLRMNLEGNSYVRGAGAGVPFVLFNIEATAEELSVHADDNTYDPDGDSTVDPRAVTPMDAFGAVTWVAERFDFDRRPPRVIDAERAYRQVLRRAGASRYRDDIDARIVADVAHRTGAVIDSQDDVGGWDEDTPTVRVPRDGDGDGMSDWWERRRGLDPRDPADGNQFDLHRRFTNLEIYLAALA